MKAVVSVGSNIDPEKNILNGFNILRETHPHVQISGFYWTAPVGDRDQPPYINGLWKTFTDLDRQEFQALLTEIENRCGRERIAGDKFASRTLDLDLFLWDNELIDAGELLERTFLQKTLLELDKDIVVDGKPLRDIFTANKIEYRKAGHLVSAMEGVLHG